MLNDPRRIEALDSGGMSRLLQSFDGQLEEALGIGMSQEVPKLSDVRNILLCGMGGSAIGGDFIRSYLGENLKVPLLVHRNYEVPGFADRSTLVFVVSYSGETEEALSSFRAAQRLGCKTVCLASGGSLQQLAREEGCLYFQVPGGIPPRTALAYCAIPPLLVLARAGLIADCLEEIRASVQWVRTRIQAYGLESPMEQNRAKELALRIHGRIPVVYGSQDRLDMVAMRWRAQFTENAKQLAFWGALPEMNHNELEGWKHPKHRLESMLPVFLRDAGDHPPVQRRLEMTRSVMARGGRQPVECWSEGESWMERLWTLILLGDFASFYLACLNREDPVRIQAIQDLKEHIQRQRDGKDHV